MFDIAPSELLLVAVVALVVIGPKDLPRAMRFVGQWVAKARGVARHFRSGIDEMIRQAELEEMEKKWAAENERIMREHPAQAVIEHDPAPQAETIEPTQAITHMPEPEPTPVAEPTSDTAAPAATAPKKRAAKSGAESDMLPITQASLFDAPSDGAAASKRAPRKPKPAADA